MIGGPQDSCWHYDTGQEFSFKDVRVRVGGVLVGSAVGGVGRGVKV